MSARPNGNNTDATLRVRVDNLAEDLHGLATDLRDVRAQMVTRSDIALLAGQITDLAAKQEAGARPNWQMWGVVVTAVVAFGTITYFPILRSVDENKVSIKELAQHIQQDVVFRNAFTTYTTGVQRQFDERKLLIDRNATDIQSLLTERLSNSKSVASVTTKAEELEKRFTAISERLAQHIRDEGMKRN